MDIAWAYPASTMIAGYVAFFRFQQVFLFSYIPVHSIGILIGAPEGNVSVASSDMTHPRIVFVINVQALINAIDLHHVTVVADKPSGQDCGPIFRNDWIGRGKLSGATRC
jgi:hypothetical protein